MFKKLLQYYQIFCNLSLDVIVGVWCCMISLPICFKITIPQIWYLALPLLTWSIYLTDHLIDVFRTKNEYPTPRHQFIKKYFRQIILLIIVICTINLFALIKDFNVLIFLSGVPLLLLVIFHFILVQINPQKKLLMNNKEFAIAVIYASGIFSAPIFISYLNHQNIFMLLVCYLIFALITFINLLMVSIIEFDYDKQMKNSSWVISISKKNAVTVFYNLIGLVFLVAFGALPFADEKIKTLLFIYQLMAFGHLLIFVKRKMLMPFLKYRKLSEILFWFPGLVYFLFAKLLW